MHDADVAPAREPAWVVTDSLSQVTDDICRPLGARPTALWWAGFLVSVAVMLAGVAAVRYEIATGIGTWGLNRTVGWAFDITNFVFWIGIGHAGTLISAILFLLRQRWRTSVNRAAEAMTLFAVMCAGLFPVIHMGRPWLAFWMIPYPNMRGSLWINFRSPLVWDFFAISTYFTISLVFWYIGLMPDLATVRDRARPGIGRRLATWFSLGWNGSYRTWLHYEVVYLLLAGLATPLVISVHTIVSWDFATSVIPGWHATVFPPYFVAGAIYAGFAMVLTLAIPLRAIYGLQDFITMKHLDNMARVMLVTGLIVFYGYNMEVFFGWYSANEFEQFMIHNRMTGPYAPVYWALIVCNGVVPQVLWSKRVRHSIPALFAVAMVVNVGMWLERFIIVVTSLHRDFLPSSWDMYYPTFWDWSTFIGTLGLFVMLMFLFIRVLPMISIFEMRTLLPEAKAKAEASH